MINNIYSLTNNNSNYFSNFDEKAMTMNNGERIIAWTPEKTKNYKENNSFINNDSTLTGITFTTTNNKSNISMSIDTPIKKKKANSGLYEASIRTPIKKTKKRECTPAYSDGEEEPKEIRPIELEEYNFNFNSSNSFENNFDRNTKFNNFDSYLTNTHKNHSLQNNYNLLKLNNKTNYNPDLLNEGNKFTRSDIRFQKISKSKFLQKIDQMEEITNPNTKLSEFIESDQIKEKIKGNYLLYVLENEYCLNIQNLFFTIIEENDLFNKITNLICYSFFDGFNNRSDIFFKFLSSAIYLEIVDQPLNSFENNLSMLTNHIISFDPLYDNSQIDFLPEEAKYIISLKGKSMLNSPNRDILNFIISIRICLNLTDDIRIRSDAIKLEEIIYIDFIKIKIFPDN